MFSILIRVKHILNWVNEPQQKCFDTTIGSIRWNMSFTRQNFEHFTMIYGLWSNSHHQVYWFNRLESRKWSFFNFILGMLVLRRLRRIPGWFWWMVWLNFLCEIIEFADLFGMGCKIRCFVFSSYDYLTDGFTNVLTDALTDVLTDGFTYSHSVTEFEKKRICWRAEERKAIHIRSHRRRGAINLHEIFSFSQNPQNASKLKKKKKILCDTMVFQIGNWW